MGGQGWATVPCRARLGLRGLRGQQTQRPPCAPEVKVPAEPELDVGVALHQLDELARLPAVVEPGAPILHVHRLHLRDVRPREAEEGGGGDCWGSCQLSLGSCAARGGWGGAAQPVDARRGGDAAAGRTARFRALPRTYHLEPRTHDGRVGEHHHRAVAHLPQLGTEELELSGQGAQVGRAGGEAGGTRAHKEARGRSPPEPTPAPRPHAWYPSKPAACKQPPPPPTSSPAPRPRAPRAPTRGWSESARWRGR